MKSLVSSIGRLVVIIAAAFSASTYGDSGEIVNPRVRWAFQTEGPIRGSVALSSESVYFGSADGYVYAVAKENGALRWKFQTGGAIAGAPAIAGDAIIVSGRASTVRALSSRDGTPIWSFEMQPTLPTPTEWNYFTAPPIVDGEQVLIASGDGHLYALDLATGRQRWAFKTEDSLRAAPLVVGDTIYQPSGDDHVYALSRRDGALLWKFATAGVGYDLSAGYIRSDIFTRPVLEQGLLLFGSRDANVYAVDVASRTKRWTFAYDSTWAMSITADHETAYVGWSTNNKVNALDLSSGKQRWEFDVGSHSYTAGLLLGEHVYWGSANGAVHKLDRRTGELRWRYDIGSDIYSSIVHDHGTLYFGTDDGRLIALTSGHATRHKAVYLPANIPDGIRGFVIDPEVEPYLRDRGYIRLDSADALTRWIASRTREDAESVVVFAFAQIPTALIGSDPANGALRRYLEAGGKVVWPWGIPNKVAFDEAGQFVSNDPSIAARLLDIEFLEFEDSGNYYSRATQAGRNWGMPAWLKTTFSSLKPGNDVTALATDEYGRTSAFHKRFHPRVGSGWISYSPKGYGAPITQAELATFERIASYAID